MTTRTLSKPVNRLRLLRDAEIFRTINDTVLESLAASMDEVVLPAQHQILNQGETGQLLYVVDSGRVKVHVGQHKLAELTRGACFGAISIFEGQPYAASVTSVKESRCFVLSRQQVLAAIEDSPDIELNLMTFLSKRLRRLNQVSTTDYSMLWQLLSQQPEAQWAV